MAFFWREAGLTYIQYSNICAKVVRSALKPKLRADAEKRNISLVQFTKWVNGKPVPKIVDDDEI